MAIKFTNFTFICPPKYTQIEIFGLQICIPSVNPVFKKSFRFFGKSLTLENLTGAVKVTSAAVLETHFDPFKIFGVPAFMFLLVLMTFLNWDPLGANYDPLGVKLFPGGKYYVSPL
jgi:hypothetical protein